MPLIKDQLDRFGKGRFFTSLDTAFGFHQIPIHEDSIEKTAFVTPDGHFKYLRMPFGLANAPAVFQTSVNLALGNLKDSIALVYLDDILIPNVTYKDGLVYLRQVLKALDSVGFSLNIEKCRFLQSSLEYLEREISGNGIRPGRAKIQALLDSPVLGNVKQVRQSMGLASYFRKFIPAFASKTACITHLTKQNVVFKLGEAQESARQYVINYLTSRPLLAVFDPEIPTELHTDASNIGYGAILIQKHDNISRVVAYFSKRTTENEAKYHFYELETLAIIQALKHF